jgi:hypothetical protein
MEVVNLLAADTSLPRLSLLVDGEVIGAGGARRGELDLRRAQAGVDWL